MDVHIDQKMKRLVAQEKETRANMIALLREIDRRKLWQEAGCKSLKDYCITKLRYDEFELREILVELGHVITARQLVDGNPKVQRRIDNLTEWRRDRARREDVSPYLIISNRTLLDIARANPKDKDGLLNIAGMGDIRVKRFGQQILNCLT